MNKRYSLLTLGIVFIAMGVLLFSCRSPKPAAGKPEKGTEQKSQTPPDPELLIKAKTMESTENFAEAFILYQQYHQAYPNDPVGCYELARIYHLRSEYKKALPLLEQAVKADPGNKWYKILLAETYEIDGKYDQAIKAYQGLILDFPLEVSYYSNLARLYILLQKYQPALNTLDKIEKLLGPIGEIIAIKVDIYKHLKENDKAIAELEKIISVNPDDSRYMFMLAEFYNNIDDTTNAYKTYQRILKQFPGDEMIYLSLADYYLKSGQKEKAFQSLRTGFSNPLLDIDTKIAILLSFYASPGTTEDVVDQAYQLLDILTGTHPEDAKSFSILADFLIRDKRYAEARDALQKTIQLDSSRYVIWEQLLRLEADLEDYDAMASESQRAIELFPEQPLLYMFNGLAHYQKKSWEVAATAFRDGSMLVVDNDEMLSQFYMYLGDVYHQLGRAVESDEAYDKSLSLDPDNEYVLNNYAYYLSLRDLRLEDAEKMSKKSLQKDLNNPSFQDTYGWILYKLGRYEEAGKWVGKALEQAEEQDNSEILEHYGDIQFKLGNTEKALEYWNRALVAGGKSENLKKKIADKKLYE